MNIGYNNSCHQNQAHLNLFKVIKSLANDDTSANYKCYSSQFRVNVNTFNQQSGTLTDSSGNNEQCRNNIVL